MQQPPTDCIMDSVGSNTNEHINKEMNISVCIFYDIE